MKHRKLRIAWSVAWGVVATLVVALWVRSYAVVDIAKHVGTAKIYGIRSEHGCMRVVFGMHTTMSSVIGWSVNHDKPKPTHTGFRWHTVTDGTTVVDFPHWSFVLLIGATSVAPWLSQLRMRFSLRTLLIATTLVAVGLGMIVWSINK